MDEMKKSGYVTDVNTDVQSGMPEVQLTPNREKLAQHAVALSTVTSVINALMGGAILTGQTEYSKDGHRYEIELRLIASQRDKVLDLHRIKLRNNRGEVVPLTELVETKVNPSLMLISRLNRSRAITVYANPAGTHSQDEALKQTEKLARSMLPPGYTIKMTGSSQSFRESFQSLIAAMLLGILVSYMVLASQFNSFIHPVTVLMALPFSFTGAFIGLWADLPPVDQHVQPHRLHPAHGDRQEELDPARGLHQSDARRRAWTSTRRSSRLAPCACAPSS